MEEAEVFKNALSQERKLALDYGFDGLLPRRDDEMELTLESAIWMSTHFPGATNS